MTFLTLSDYIIPCLYVAADFLDFNRLMISLQAEFSEINLVVNATGSFNVDLDAIRNGHKVTKYVLFCKV